MKQLLLTIISVLILVGCGNSYTPPKLLAIEENYHYYKVHFQEKKEVWNDPEIQSYPRAQFLWKAPGREIATIWSMRLDGTDLRETADEELLSIPKLGNYSSGTPYVRSPSGRYLAIVRVLGLSKQKRVIDLEERKVDLLSGDATTSSAGDTKFVWVNDHIVLFDNYSRLKSFNVLTKDIIDLANEPEFKHLTIHDYFVRDSRNPIATNSIHKELILFTKQGRFIYDYQTRALIGELNKVGHSLSKDGNHWIVPVFGSKARAPLGGPRVYKFDEVSASTSLGSFGEDTNHDPMIIDDINTLYSKGPNGVRVARLNDPKVIDYTLPENNIRNFAIYSYSSKLNGKSLSVNK